MREDGTFEDTIAQPTVHGADYAEHFSALTGHAATSRIASRLRPAGAAAEMPSFAEMLLIAGAAAYRFGDDAQMQRAITLPPERRYARYYAMRVRRAAVISATPMPFSIAKPSPIARFAAPRFICRRAARHIRHFRFYRCLRCQ